MNLWYGPPCTLQHNYEHYGLKDEVDQNSENSSLFCLQLCQILTDFKNFFTVRKSKKIQQEAHNISCQVAALPCEIA